MTKREGRRRGEGKKEGEEGRRRERKEGGEGDEADLNVLQGGVNDLVVVRETVELESLQVQPDMVTHLCHRGQHHGTSH